MHSRELIVNGLITIIHVDEGALGARIQQNRTKLPHLIGGRFASFAGNTTGGFRGSLSAGTYLFRPMEFTFPHQYFLQYVSGIAHGSERPMMSLRHGTSRSLK